MNENKNLVIAVGASIAILFGFNFLYEQPKLQEQISQTAPAQEIADPQQSDVSAAAPSPDVVPATQAPQPVEDIPSEALTINTDTLNGEINTRGVSFTKFDLRDYKETTQKNSPDVNLLSAATSQISGMWHYVNGENAHTPNAHSVWKRTSTNSTLTPTTPISLRWSNAQGVVYERVISVDENYLMTFTDSVINQSTQAVALYHQAKVTRPLPEKSDSMMISHEGPIGVWHDKLQEFSYDDIKDKPESASSDGGWIGFGDKYWLTSLLPDPHAKVNYQFTKSGDLFEATLTHKQHTIQPGERISVSYYAFVGPKKLHLLDTYEEKYGFQHFDLAVDFGWFYFLTKPIFLFLTWLYSILGNMGIAILVLTIITKALLYPLAAKSFRSMAKLKKLQPRMEQIRKTYKSDPQRLQQEMMKIYKKEEVNPMGGCLPLLIQAPIFFCLYKVFYVTIEMRQAPFFGWIKDLSAPDPTNLFNLFGLLPFTPPSFLHIGLLPIIMGVTMLLQQRLGPQPADPTQAKVMMIMPIMFTFLFASFPSGVVIYWTFSNLLGIIQQYLMTRETK